jgi:hypothetical protein
MTDALYFFPSALQLRVSFGLLNNQPPFLSVLHLFRRSSVEWYNEEVRRMWMEEAMAHLFPLIFHSFHPSEADNVVPEQFSFYGVRLYSLTPNPQLGGPGYPSSSGSYPLTCPAWVTLPVATLPPA